MCCMYTQVYPACIHMHIYMHICVYVYVYTFMLLVWMRPVTRWMIVEKGNIAMGWLRLVGSLQVSFEKEPYKSEYILQKRPSSLVEIFKIKFLSVDSKKKWVLSSEISEHIYKHTRKQTHTCTRTQTQTHTHTLCCVRVCVSHLCACVYIYVYVYLYVWVWV